MKTVAVFVCLLIWECAAQFTNIICYNPPSGLYEVNDTKMSMISEQAGEMINMEWEGLSIEEAASTFSQLVNQTFITLFMEALTKDENITIGSFAAATLQGLLDTTMGLDVVNASFQEPTIFAQLVSDIVADFDRTCMDDPNAVLWDTIAKILSTILPAASREQFQAVSIQGGEKIATLLGDGQLWTDVLTSVTQDLDLSSLGGFLGLFGSSDAGELILPILNNLFESALSFPTGVADSVAGILSDIQAAYQFDIEGLVAYALDIANGIIQELN